jgi:transcriptional regulator with XRE-family HTH domain
MKPNNKGATVIVREFIPLQDEDLAASLGARLKELRSKSKLTIEDLADAADVARRSYHEWELGYRLPRLPSLIRVCNFYKLSIEDLLMWKK